MGPAPSPPRSRRDQVLVTFARTGISVPFDQARASLPEMAEAWDVPGGWSSCTPVLAGQTGYAPEPLELLAEGEVLVGCARPAGDLVLDM